jgi:hypothetical protein
MAYFWQFARDLELLDFTLAEPALFSAGLRHWVVRTIQSIGR